MNAASPPNTVLRKGCFMPHGTGIFCIIFGVTALFFNSLALQPAEKLISHMVQKSESISLICIDYYGHYSGIMGDAIVKMNPGLKNIHQLAPGRTLKLRNPAYTPSEKEPGMPLFDKSAEVAQGVVTFVQGKASIIPQNSSRAAALSANTLVYPGDRLITGDNGIVEIIINRESVIRIGSDSRLGITYFRDKIKGREKTSVEFSVGSAWVKVKDFGDYFSRLELAMPHAAANVYGAAACHATVSRDQSSEIVVYDGKAKIDGKAVAARRAENDSVTKEKESRRPSLGEDLAVKEWALELNAIHALSISGEGRPEAPATVGQKPDTGEWIQWNSERDTRIEAIFQKKGR
jgi:phage tail protein X